MNNRIDDTDQELDDFLNGESDLNKIYAERESLTVPEHLEKSVKNMAREVAAGNDTIENIATAKSKTRYKRKFYFPIALAASVLVVVTVTVVFFPNQSVEIKYAQTPDKITDVLAADSAQTVKINSNRNAEARDTEIVQQNVQPEDKITQRVEPAQSNVANDVKKSTFKKREQLVENTKQSKAKPPGVEPEATDIARQAPYEIPPHISELLTNTHAGDQQLNAMPPTEILHGWQKSQWIEQVTVLTKQGKRELAERYVQAFPEYFPDESIRYLLNP